MIGFWPEEIKGQIYQYYYDFKHIMDVLDLSEIQPFYEQLSRNWFSPKAVEFEDAHMAILLALTHFANFVCTSICEDAVTVYNYFANANGYATITYDRNSSTPTFDHPNSGINSDESYNKLVTMYTDPKRLKKMKAQAPDGRVGMNAFIVKGLAASLKFQIAMSMRKLYELPFDFAVYDPNDEIKNLFRERIINLMEKLNGEASNIYNTIEKAIGEEIDLQATAVRQATDSLNG